MSLIEDDLLAALRELYGSSKDMTSGKLPSAEAMERYHLALTWAERVMKSAEGGQVET